MVAMSIAHALIEFVPSMLLGVPQEGTATSILPGHRMVLQGRSKEVIRIVSVGGFGAIIVTILMMPIFAVALPIMHDLTKPFTWIILLAASVYLTYSMTNSMRDFLWSLLLFILSGILGWIIFQTPIGNLGLDYLSNPNFIRSVSNVHIFRSFWNKHNIIQP